MALLTPCDWSLRCIWYFPITGNRMIRLLGWTSMATAADSASLASFSHCLCCQSSWQLCSAMSAISRVDQLLLLLQCVMEVVKGVGKSKSKGMQRANLPHHHPQYPYPLCCPGMAPSSFRLSLVPWNENSMYLVPRGTKEQYVFLRLHLRISFGRNKMDKLHKLNG